MYNEIREYILERIRDRLDDPSVIVSENSTLMDDIDFSSLDILVVLAEIEEKYNVFIEDKDLRKIFTVKDVIDYIYNNKK